MTATVLDQDYLAPPEARPIKARPLGTFAALMMGVSAITALGSARFFFAAPPATEQPAVAAKDAAKEPQVLSPPRAQTAGESAAEPAGLAAAARAAVFELAAPDFVNEKKTVASRDLETGGREDSLSLGEFAFGGPYLRLDVHQSGAEKPSDFYLDVTRHAREAGLAVKKIHTPIPLATRLGRLESADIKLTSADPGNGPGVERACLAVRLVNPAFEVSGVACGSAAKPIDRAALGCLLDQIDYRPSFDNKPLEQLFAAHDAHGGACGATLDAKKPPHAAAHAKVNRKNLR